LFFTGTLMGVVWVEEDSKSKGSNSNDLLYILLTGTCRQAG